MPNSREIVPEGAPAQIFEYFRKNPGRTLRAAIEQLKLDLSTAYYGLTRLHDLHLLKRVGRKRPARWETVEDLVELPSSAPLVAAAVGGPIRLFSSQPVYRPTGSPIAHVNEVQCFRISAGKARERDYCRDGAKRDPGDEHPWSYPNRNKQAA